MQCTPRHFTNMLSGNPYTIRNLTARLTGRSPRYHRHSTDSQALHELTHRHPRNDHNFTPVSATIANWHLYRRFGSHLEKVHHHHHASCLAVKIPTKHPVPYCDIVRPILETQRIQREEISTLVCRDTHVIKTRSMKHRENDNLHAIFATLISQSPQFIRNWLKSFMLLHKNIMLLEKGKFYLDSKSYHIING